VLAVVIAYEVVNRVIERREVSAASDETMGMVLEEEMTG